MEQSHPVWVEIAQFSGSGWINTIRLFLTVHGLSINAYAVLASTDYLQNLFESPD